MAGDLHACIWEQLEKADDIEPSIKSFFLSPGDGILYGAGMQARIALLFSALAGKRILGVLVSPGGRNDLGNRIHPPLFTAGALPESLDRGADALIAMNAKWNAEITAALCADGFEAVHRAADWPTINRAINRAALRCYLKFYDFIEYSDENGNSCVRRDFSGGVFRLPFHGDDAVFLNDISGEFHDIVLPSLFGNTDYLIDGPYESGDVALREGDVVFDLGANVGLFTAVAAAKGCRVYSFEPTPVSFGLGYLEKTAALYPGVSICPCAVADVKGRVAFNINASLDKNASTVSNSLLPRGGFAGVEVDAVSLDDFVEDNSIERVDFIKADIEGAERLMLQGAKRTLARFAPKLALCTYHLPDDPEVMERLILEANPKYVIEHKWSKLYAHCR